MDGTPSDDLPLAGWQALMTGAGLQYDLITILDDGSQSWAPNAVPSASQLAQYDTVIWFTRDNDNNGSGSDMPISTDQQSILTGWLDLGDKTLVVFSEYFVEDYYASNAQAWTTAATIPFFTNYVPLQGAEYDPFQWSSASGDQDINGLTFTVSGSTTVSASFGALTWDIVPNPSYNDQVSVVNPAVGTDTLATVQADPLETNTGNIASPVAAGKKNVGAKGTSTAIYVGFPVENAISGGSFSSAQEFFNGLVLTYAGVP